MSGVTSVELSFPCQPSYTPTPTPAPCQYQAPSLIPQAERASDTTIDATLFQSKPFFFCILNSLQHIRYTRNVWLHHSKSYGIERKNIK